MAIVARSDRKPEIDLSGPDGNAFVLLALARRYARDLGLDWDAISAEMTSGNYYHLIRTFDRHFGDYVNLVAAGDNDRDEEE
jgi:hypothetical protein